MQRCDTHQTTSDIKNCYCCVDAVRISGGRSEAEKNREIGHGLHLSEGTVKECLNRRFRNLAVRHPTELAVWTLRESASYKVPPPTCGDV